MDRVLQDEAIDTVVHLAAQAVVGPANDDPVPTFEHNILGTWATLDACRRAPGVTVVVVASSDKAYGNHGDVPYEEAMALLGRHPYAASKTCADVLAQTYADSYGLPVGITRCGNMYGGGDTEWSRIVPGTIRSILSGERPARSDGEQLATSTRKTRAHGVPLPGGARPRQCRAVAGEAFLRCRRAASVPGHRILRPMTRPNPTCATTPNDKWSGRAAKAHEVFRGAPLTLNEGPGARWTGTAPTQAMMHSERAFLQGLAGVPTSRAPSLG
jgi:hypothetical protein